MVEIYIPTENQYYNHYTILAEAIGLSNHVDADFIYFMFVKVSSLSMIGI